MTTKTTPDFRYQLYRLDQAIFQLLDERARLTAQLTDSPTVDIEDLLARHLGSLNAQELRTIASAIDGACQAYSERHP